MKICRICGTEKPLSEFYADRTMKDGYRSACKECTRAAVQEYKATNKGKVSELNRRYRESEHGAEVKRQCELRRRSTEKFKEYKRQWARTEKGKASRRRRCQRHEKTKKGKASRTRAKAKRRSNLQDVICTLTDRDWQSLLKTHRYACAYCGTKFTDDNPPTQDHVVPISKGGAHTKQNVVPACRSCNSRKKDRVWLTS